MERVVTINLNGNSYQLEEPAYDALRAYISRAEAALAANPDKAEIIRDLEQAIADKCSVHLGPGKTVVNAAEMARVLAEMGPVEGEAKGDEAPRTDGGGYAGPRRRLYRIKDGANIAGVSTGMAAFFDIDVNIIRLLWIVAALFTSGAAVLVYIAMMFLVPSAHTSEEWAAAHGVPFNAQEVIDRAKREYSRFTEENGGDWRASLRAQRRAWRHQWRTWRHGRHAPPPPGPPVSYVTRIFAGLVAFILTLVGAALLIGFLLAVFSLLNTQAVFGWTPPFDIPAWLAIVILFIVYAALSSPLRHLRRGSYATASGYRYAEGADGLLAVVAGALLAYHFIPEFRDWVRDLPEALQAVRLSLNL